MKRIYQRFIAMLLVVSIAMSTVLPTRNITYAAVNDSKETANLFERAIAAFMVTVLKFKTNTASIFLIVSSDCLYILALNK